MKLCEAVVLWKHRITAFFARHINDWSSGPIIDMPGIKKSN